MKSLRDYVIESEQRVMESGEGGRPAPTKAYGSSKSTIQTVLDVVFKKFLEANNTDYSKLFTSGLMIPANIGQVKNGTKDMKGMLTKACQVGLQQYDDGTTTIYIEVSPQIGFLSPGWKMDSNPDEFLKKLEPKQEDNASSGDSNSL